MLAISTDKNFSRYHKMSRAPLFSATASSSCFKVGLANQLKVELCALNRG
jgi:hypothetical protein